MKWLFFILLAANVVLALFVYARERLPSPDAQLVTQQINADQIRIVPPRPAAPVAAAPTPGPGPGVCLQWGSFGAAELPKAQAALDGLALGERARKIDVAVLTSYWTYVPPQRTRQNMERKVNELKALGVSDYLPILETGRWRYAISLGIFRTEEAARNNLGLMKGKGVRSAQFGEREQRTTQTAFLIRDPNESQTTQLANLKSKYAGSDVRAVDCPPF